MTVKQRRWLLVLALIAGVLALDAVSKKLITNSLTPGELREPIPALGEYFQITLSYNTGAAFGILPQAGNIFLTIAVVVVVGMLLFYNRIPDNAPVTRMATGLVVGGALGNALDRIQHGHVIDFIHYSLPQLDLSNVSNLADHAIVLGVILVLLDSWRLDRIEQRRAQERAESTSPNISGETEDGESVV